MHFVFALTFPSAVEWASDVKDVSSVYTSGQIPEQLRIERAATPTHDSSLTPLSIVLKVRAATFKAKTTCLLGSALLNQQRSL